MPSNRKENLPVRPLDLRDFGKRLRTAMESRHTQESLAAAIGVSVSGIKKWLSGGTDPGWSGVVAAAQTCGISLDWLATGKGAPEPADGSAARMDAQLLSSVIGLVEEWLDQHRRSLPAAKKAEVIIALYEIALDEKEGGAAAAVKPRTVERILRLVA